MGLRIGDVELETNLLLAPIAGYCDLPFRLVVRSLRGPSGGVGLACTDLLCPQAVLGENEKSLWLAATSPRDRPLCMQLYGADGDIMAQAALWAQDHGATTIDINMGCPVDKVTKKNGGSMLLCNPAHTAERLAAKVVRAVRIPVTAKIRLGWDDRSLITRTLPVMLADVGIRAVTVHGRTTEQRFRGEARWNTAGDDCIRAVVETLARHHPQVPVIGNGDVTDAYRAKAMIDATGCQGVMIGRGALAQPWVFRDAAHYLRTGELPPPLSRAQKARVVLQHFDEMVRHRDARYALIKIKQRISWYSPQLQPWPHLRRDAQAIRDAAEFREFWLRGVERIESLGDAGGGSASSLADAPAVDHANEAALL
jgi:nifR3 family TIM-barrel protein